METRTVKRGDTDILTLVVNDSDGNAVDISGWTIELAVREKYAITDIVDDADAVISKSIEVEDGINGVVEITITSEETNIDARNYLCDFQCIKPSGAIHSSSTFIYKIEKDVTRGITNEQRR